MTEGIILLGLGPGDANLLTRQAWDLIRNISEIYLRTRQHPCVADLPAALEIHSFDDLYDSSVTFDQVYAQIIEQVLELGRRPQGVVYAVPGHPFIGETTSPEIARRARQEGIPVRVVEGLSFLEPTLSAVGIDPLPHTALVDALELAALHTPPFPPDAPAIIAQIHSPAVASDVKLTLMEVYPDEHPVTMVHAAGTDREKVENLKLYEIDRSPEIGLLTSLYLPPLAPYTSFEAFQEVIAHLRAPDGCPWDKEQTHLSLRPYMIEEAYEVLSALDKEDIDALREEFGDVLLQVVLHAQIANEEGEFRMADVLHGIATKIIRRHPHVFGDLELKDQQAVLQNWERLKAAEREKKGHAEAGLLDSVPLALPALTQAQTYQDRAARVKFDWADLQGVLDKVKEEFKEVDSAVTEAEKEHEVGDLLFSAVNLARWMKIDAESALRAANARFKERFSFIEKSAREQGKTVSDLSMDEMDALWQEAKRSEA